MQAIIRQGGKQYVVGPDTVFHVSNLNSEEKQIKLEVLAIIDGQKSVFGTPVIADAEVIAEVVENSQGPKLYIYKYKNKTKYRRKTGYRDQITTLKIKSIKS